jgi:hypothetical protein
MMETGLLIKLQGRENSYTLMVTFTRVIGLAIKLMDSEFILTQKVRATKVLGKMINSMVQGLKLGLKERNIRVNTFCLKRKERGNISGQMDQHMRGNG